jgi:hypothetical protein
LRSIAACGGVQTRLPRIASDPACCTIYPAGNRCIAPAADRHFSDPARLEARVDNARELVAEGYLKGRFANQSAYFEHKAGHNQTMYLLFRRVSLLSGILTPIAIFVVTLLVVLSESSTSKWVHLWHLVPISLSAIALGAYQWEELHNYGAQWAKFRLVAERLKRNRELFLQKARPFDEPDDEVATKQFVESCEGLIEGNDINYFVLMVDPQRREMPM